MDGGDGGWMRIMDDDVRWMDVMDGWMDDG